MFSEAPAHLAFLSQEKSKLIDGSKSATSSPVHRSKFANAKSSSLTGQGGGGVGSINAGDQAFVRLASDATTTDSAFRAESFDRRGGGDESGVLSELIKSMVECPDYLLPTFKFKNGGGAGGNELGVPAAASAKSTLRKQAALNRSCDGASLNSYTDDFILLSEFSEIEGPRPLCTWPTDGATAFNKNEYALHLMCVDFNAHLNQRQPQQQSPSPAETAANTTNESGLNSSMSSSEPRPASSASGASSGGAGGTKFQLTNDTSIINYWDADTQIAACVHHFTLYDLEARGFVRPFCLAYISYDRLKPVEFFEQMRAKFHEITDLFKISNYNAFKHDLEQRCLDLRLTRELFLKWSELYARTQASPTDARANAERLALVRRFDLDAKTCGRLSASSMNEPSKKLQLQAIEFQIRELEAIIDYMKRELVARNWLFVDRGSAAPTTDAIMARVSDEISAPGSSSEGKKCSSAVDARYAESSSAGTSKPRSGTFTDEASSLSYFKERRKFFKHNRQPYSLRFQRPTIFKNILIGNSNLLLAGQANPAAGTSGCGGATDDSFALSIDFHNLNKTTGPQHKKMKPLRELSYETIENAYEEIDGMYSYFSMPYYILKYRQLTLKSATSSHMFDSFKMVKYLTGPRENEAGGGGERRKRLSELEKVKSKFNRNFNLFWSITIGDCVVADFSLFIDEYNLNKYQLIKKTSNKGASGGGNRLSASQTIVETSDGEEAAAERESRSRRMTKAARLASSSLEPRAAPRKPGGLSHIKVFVSQAEDLEVDPSTSASADAAGQTQWYIDVDGTSKPRSASSASRKSRSKLARDDAIDDTNQDYQEPVDSSSLFYSPVNASSMMQQQPQLARRRDQDDLDSSANRTNDVFSSVCESESLRTTLVITKPEELDLDDDDDDSLCDEARQPDSADFASPKSFKNFEQLEQFLDFDENDGPNAPEEADVGGDKETSKAGSAGGVVDYYNELVNDQTSIRNILESALASGGNKDSPAVRSAGSEDKFKFIYEDYETSSETDEAKVAAVAVAVPKEAAPSRPLSAAEAKQLLFLKTQREENEYDFVNFLMDNENRKYASYALDTDIKFLKRMRLAYDQSRRLQDNFFHITIDDVGAGKAPGAGGAGDAIVNTCTAAAAELTLTDKLLKLNEYNFEETLKQLLNSSPNLMPHLLYALLKGRPVVCISRYCEGYDQLKMVLNCLSNFVPNSFHFLNNLTTGNKSSSSSAAAAAAAAVAGSIPVFTGAPPFISRAYDPEAAKSLNFNSEMTTPQLNAIFERKRIRLNDLKYCKLIGLSLCIVKEGGCCSAICCSNNNKLINSSSSSFRTSMSGDKNELFTSLSTNSTLVINSSSSALSEPARQGLGQRGNSSAHSLCHKHPHYHLNSKMTAQIIDDQLLNYIPITIRNYVSIFDLDKQTYLGPKYKGTLLNSFHAKARGLQQDSISYLYLLDRIMQYYVKMAFIYNYSILFDSFNNHQVTHQKSLDRSDSQARSQPKSISSDKTKKRERLLNFYNMIVGGGGGAAGGQASSSLSANSLNPPGSNRSRSGSLTQSIASYATAFLTSSAFSAMTNPTSNPAAPQQPPQSAVETAGNSLSAKQRGQFTRAVSAQGSSSPSAAPIEPISSLELLRVILSNVMTAQIPSLTADQLASISSTVSSGPSSAEFDMCDVSIILNVLRTLKVKQVYLYNLSMKRRKQKEEKRRLQEQMKRAASYSPPVPDFELDAGDAGPALARSFDESSFVAPPPRIDVVVSSHENTLSASVNASSSLGRPDDLAYYKQSSLDHQQQQQLGGRSKEATELHEHYQFPLTVEYEELVLFSAKK